MAATATFIIINSAPCLQMMMPILMDSRPRPARFSPATRPAGFDNGTRGTYNVDFPGMLTPTNGSIKAISYSGGLGGAAAVQYDGSLGGGKLVNWGFPFETITNSSRSRCLYVGRVALLRVLDPPTLLPVQVNLASDMVTLTWTASAGLVYGSSTKRPVRRNLAKPPAPMSHGLATTATKPIRGPGSASQRFYRIIW